MEHSFAVTQLRVQTPDDPFRMWRDRILPESGWPTGYASLIEHFQLPVPVPPRPTMVAARHDPDDATDWQVLPRRLRPEDTFEAQLEFALKYEGICLSVLNALFRAIRREVIEQYVAAAPTGKYARRTWFLYEWLTGDTLNVPDVAGRPAAIDVADASQQLALERGEMSKRHAVRNNLPGTAAFCPMVRWTEVLRSAASAGFDERAREVVRNTHPDVLTRAAAFLLLDDSRSSFEIEGERPSHDRIRRWSRAIAGAGSASVTLDELLRLQRMVIGDDRFVKIGLRQEGGFVGDRDRRTRDPLPRHISARPEDLEDLVHGIIAYDERSSAGTVDPVVAAAVVAFGFVYVHPFQDGNGRVHRWLIHHVLERAGYSPPEIPFPISAAVLRNLADYRDVLESYSAPLLDVVEYEVTERKTIHVVNETADFYRFFDATKHAEFLYRCVQETSEYDLPREVAYLKAFDAFSERIQELVDMPPDVVDLLHRFLVQNGGTLSRRARTKEFAALTEEEADMMEAIFADTHGH